MPSPSVSVVIPTYNAAPFLRATLESVFAQTHLPDEVIIVDDCSTDDTAAIVRQFADSAPRPVRLVQRAVNSGGPVIPMNMGVQSARCECVALLDQDDLMTPERLRWHITGLATPGIDFTFGWISRIDGTGQRFPGPHRVPPSRLLALARAEVAPRVWLLEGQRLYADALINGSMVGASNIAFRKSLWEQIGGFPESYRVCWDYEFFCQAAVKGTTAFLDVCVALYRTHGANLHSVGHRCTEEWLDLLARHFARPLCSLDRSRLRPVLAECYLDYGYGLATAGRPVAALAAYARAWSYGAGTSKSFWRVGKAFARYTADRIRPANRRHAG